MVRIGLDIGYGHTKIITDQGSRVCFPSVAKQGEKQHYDKMLYNTDDYLVTINNDVWYIGKMALRENQFATRAFDGTGRYNSPAFKAMLATALAACNSDNDEMLLVTGIPLASYNETKDEFEAFLNGFSARVEISGREQFVKVNHAYVFPQAAGIFFNPKSMLAITENAAVGSIVTIIDIGYRTTDVAAFEYDGTRHNFLSDYSFTVDQGMVGIFREMSKIIANDIKAFEVGFDIAENVFASGTYRAEDKDIGYRETCNIIAEKVVSSITDAYRLKRPSGAKSNIVVLAGGGSIALKEQLLKAFPYAISVEDAQFANAVGFLEVGKRLETSVF